MNTEKCADQEMCREGGSKKDDGSINDMIDDDIERKK